MPEIIKITHKGDFSKTFKLLRKMKEKTFVKKMNEYGQMGVKALSEATPVDTGLTASSWSYILEVTANGNIRLIWTNSNNNHGIYVAVLLQYGHGTRNGGYVQGRDYINPAMRPVFDKIADDAWQEVISDE